jgi:hypothetical protein
MDFGDLQRRLVAELRLRVNNGEMTERGLARCVGISQPHIHKVLKGRKILSQNFCDRILSALGLSIFDLAEDFDAEQWLRTRRQGENGAVVLDVVEGLIGPGQPWPEHIGGRTSFAVSRADIARFGHPVAVQVAADPQMAGVLAAGEWVLLDQNLEARRLPVSDALYVIFRAGAGLIRSVASRGDRVYLISEEVRETPAKWEEIRVTPIELPRLVRARAYPIVRSEQWLRKPPAFQAARLPATSR